MRVLSEFHFVSFASLCRFLITCIDMPQDSIFQIDIPGSDVLSFVLPSGEAPSKKPIWINSEDTSKSISLAQLEVWVKRLGLGLQKMGLKQGDVVMVFSSSHIFMPVVYLGLPGAGFVFTGCNPAYGPQGIRRFSLLKPDSNIRQRSRIRSRTRRPKPSLWSPHCLR